MSVSSRMRLTGLSICLAMLTSWAATPEAVDPDSLFWDGPLGCQIDGSRASFFLFTPRASSVTAYLYATPDGPSIAHTPLAPLRDGCWTTDLDLPNDARYYGYCLDGAESTTVIGDPYSKAVATVNEYQHRGRTLLFPPDQFDWEGDSWLSLSPEDVIIYEAHVRDLTAHPSAGIPDSLRGSYRGLCVDGCAGGLAHLVDLGINAVELLPVQDFGNIEVPFEDPAAPVLNTWNPYERNHWGYMTSYFFAPESYYGSGATMEPGQICGADGRQVTEFKELVKTLHSRGIAVILDVVYNHVSQYDYNPLKYIDTQYYFRLTDDGSFLSLSGCGNDLKTERPMTRRLIVDSVLYWMEEYHIDGFRFDLATMIDQKTLDEITTRAMEKNPNVLLIAEAWGGGKYDLGAFSKIGWAVWNDRIRNSLKGRDPLEEPGFLLGSFLPGETKASVINHLCGSTISGGGPLLEPTHSVNYLESHDDHTMGDFLRLALGRCHPDSAIVDLDIHARLSDAELEIHRMLALALFSSQGMVMLAQGQEFGRSKVISPTKTPDSHVGHLDHNSYEKDNETNWLNYHHRDMNQSLNDYYTQLIRLRKGLKGLGGVGPEEITELETGDSLCVALYIDASQVGDPGDLILLLNPSPHEIHLDLPQGTWRALVTGETVSTRETAPPVDQHFTIPPRSGALLME